MKGVREGGNQLSRSREKESQGRASAGGSLVELIRSCACIEKENEKG